MVTRKSHSWLISSGPSTLIFLVDIMTKRSVGVVNFSKGEWVALVRDKGIGTFPTVDKAKAAVEKELGLDIKEVGNGRLS